jgi:hypothetical protein
MFEIVVLWQVSMPFLSSVQKFVFRRNSVMEFECKSGGLPAGAYSAEFLGCSKFEGNEDKGYGPAVKLAFKVLSGPEAGNEGGRICAANLTPKSALGKLAVALKGSPVATGERFSFDAYVGVKGTILVEATDNGGSKITTFLKQA